MASVRNFELMQELEYIDTDRMIEVLNTKECIVNYAYIIHDKDVYESDGYNSKQEFHKKGDLKPPHVHCYVRLESPRNIVQIANWFRVKEQYINKVRTRFEKCLSYLTHDNHPNKYQYEKEQVVSNFDFQHAIDISNESSRLEQIVAMIGQGTITRSNYTEYISILEMTKFKRQVDTAFKYVDDRNRKEINRNMKVIYIQGESRSGKSTYAKKIAKDKNYSTFIMGSSNDVLDGYCNEECIILDDLRPSCMGLSDLIKMLDNNTNSSVRSRYYNKIITNCKLIIITTVLDIETFFKNVFQEEKEPIMQLKRRCQTKIRMTKENMYVQYYDEKIEDYSQEYECENPVKDVIISAEKTEEQAIDELNDLLGIQLEYGKHEIDDSEKFMQLSIEDMNNIEDLF